MSTLGSYMMNIRVYRPLLARLLAGGVLLRFSVPVEVRPQFLRVFLISGCETQLHHALIEAH